MDTLTPKQLEIRNREEKILEVARPLILRDGYQGLSMEKIAAELEYSKGTIYNHFSCKEEIVVALAIQSANVRVNQFRKAAEFSGQITISDHVHWVCGRELCSQISGLLLV